MKRNVLFHMAIFAFATLALTDANAASAVSTDDNGNIAAACGDPVEKAKQRAFADAHRRYGPRHFRIFASTPLTGYCAITPQEIALERYVCEAKGLSASPAIAG
jgi:hypothetical protein